MDWLFQTDGSYSYVILRFGLAVTFFMHGTQHAFGWHGGKGAKAQVTNWRDKYHIPLPMGFFALFIELFAVFAMTFGFLVRPAAFGLAVFIGFALVLGHWSNGFILAQGPGEGAGIEYTLALVLMSAALVIGGAGALSLDGWIVH
ncbi:MAG TPA: DoxX family protein [Candidatus Binatia bacterium]|nr:DoxX family protein [Candidatus Binatia bacterium]